jgi:hypothetical protein
VQAPVVGWLTQVKWRRLGGDDFVYVNDGDIRDSANGGPGYDWCYVDAAIEAANSCEKVVACRARGGLTAR